MSRELQQKECVWPETPNADGKFICPNCGTSRKNRPKRICRTQAEQTREINEYNKKKRDRLEKQASSALVAPRPKNNPPNWGARVFRWMYAILRWMCLSAYHRRWLIRGEAEYLRVKAICQSCPHDMWDAEKEACKKCGCGGKSKVVLLNKIKLESEHCPMGEW